MGLGLLGGFIAVSDLEHVGDYFRLLGPTAPLVLIPYFFVNTVDTFGWRCTLPAGQRHRAPFISLYLIRMAGEAVNSVTPTATVGGEPVKAHLLRAFGVTGSDGFASVVVARTALVVSQAAFVALGSAALFVYLGRPALAGLWLAVLLALVAVFSYGLVHLQQRGLAAAAWRMANRIAPRARFVARLEAGAHSVDVRLREFYGLERSTFVQASLLHLFAWGLGAWEVHFIMVLIGSPISWLEAFVVEALAQPIRGVALVIPGGLGAQEWGGMWLCQLLGMSAPEAVTLWLIKRGREIVFDGIGLAYLAKRTRLGRGA